jgi:CHASE2 domain-containing sensor protein
LLLYLPRMWRSAAQFMLLVLLLGLFLMRESRQSPGNAVDAFFIDWISANTARQTPGAPVSLVEINDSSLEGHLWPWSPLDFALFLQAVLPFGPAVVSIEHVLQWQKTQAEDWQQKRPQYARILHDLVLRTPKLLLGAELGFPEDPDVIPPVQPVPIIWKVQGNASAIPEFVIVERQPREEYRLSSTLGFINLPRSDSIVRKAPLVFRYRGQVVPALVLQAMMLWLKLTPDDLVVELGSQIWLGNKISIPIDEAGYMRVDFKTPYVRFGFDELLLAIEQMQAAQPMVVPKEAISGKVVLLGRTDKVAQTLRLPTGRRGSSSELFAAAIATIQNGTFIRRVPGVFDFGIIVMGMALCPLYIRWRRDSVVIFSIVALVVYVLVALTIFGAWLVWMPMLLPLGLLLFMVLFRLFMPARL